MRIQIVSNIDNGKGLERDYHLLSGLLTSFGHDVRGVHFERERRASPADLVIFLEVYEPRLAELAPRRWLVPNAEWWYPDRGLSLSDFELVLCKTRDALSHFAPLTPRCRHVGFLSEDRFEPAIPRARRFLHIPGGSDAKGTEAVLAAWDRHRIPYPLTVVSWLGWPRRPRNVEFAGRLDERRLWFLQNAARFHLCPSRYEGWGHVLHEGLSTGAAVTVPDTPAMNEIDGCALRIPARPGVKQGMVQTTFVTPESVRDAVERCMAFTEADLQRIHVAAREAFLSERARFVASLREVLGEKLAGATAGHATGTDTLSEIERTLPRAVRAVAVPALRGLYGGVVVIGTQADAIARDIVRLAGLATRVATAAELAELPNDYACGAVLSDVLGGVDGEEKERILSEVRRVVKATGPVVIVEIVRGSASGGGAAGPEASAPGTAEIRVHAEHVGV